MEICKPSTDAVDPHCEDSKNGQLNAAGSDVAIKGGKCSVFKQLPPLRVVMTLAACLVIEFILGVSYTTGNMMPYLTSYLRNVTGDTSLDYSDTLWVDNVTWLVVYGITAFVGLLEKRLHERLYLFLGIAAIGMSFAGSYWAVQTSLLLVVLVMGALHGLGQAMLWPAAVNIAIRWFPGRKGLVGASVMTGYGAGAFAWNQLATAWINPLNLQPDQQIGEDFYFTQPEVLDNVPSYFLMMGGILSGILLLCLVSIVFPPTPTFMETQSIQDLPTAVPSMDSNKLLNEQNKDSGIQNVDLTEEVIQDNATDALKQENGKLLTNTETDFVNMDLRENCVLNGEISEIHLGPETSGGPPCSVEMCSNPSVGVHGSFVDLSHCDPRCTRSEEKATDPRSYTPLEVLKCRAAWTVWFLHLFLEFGFIFVWAFYKTYGQTFIHNDHFLALVGSFASVFNSVARPFWGWLADKIGFQPTIMLCQVVLAGTMATFPLCEKAPPAVYFAWVCLMYLAISAYYSLQAPLIFAMFGPRYFTYGVGVVYSSGVISFLLSVFVVSAIKEPFGWHGVFLLGAASVFISLFFNTSLLLDCGHPIPAHMKKELFFSRKRKANN